MHGLVREEAVVRLVPRPEAVVEPGAAAEGGIDVPVREGNVEQPGVVESGIADTRVPPVDHAGEAAAANEKMVWPEVGVEERRLEADQGLDLGEELLCLQPLVAVDQGKDEPLELRALPAVRADPVDAVDRKPGWVERMQRVEERADAVGVVVDERLAADHGVADEERVARDVLERRHSDRERGRERRQQRDLELERLLDAGAPREAEHPLVVDDRDLEVVAGVDLQNRPRSASERVCDLRAALVGQVRRSSRYFFRPR